MLCDNFAFVILGASGDLAHRKLIPALFKMYQHREFEASCIIVGCGRSDFTDEEFRARHALPEDFSKHMFYYKGIKGLKTYLAEKGTFSKIIVFMALPPEVYAATAQELFNEGFQHETSLLIEKPFGYDLESARELNRHLSQFYDESQVYRNDHYLAKEAVQNILVFRFANTIFQPLWDASVIESIQINATETLGVESRGAYYDHAGAIRDVAQNHLLQLLCLMTMEAPVTLSAGDIGAKKMDVLRALTVEKCLRYQYEGFTQEKGVNPQSTTETFAELQMSINNFRWAGMPIYIRCGKGATRTGTEICVRFKNGPKVLFNENGAIPANAIIFKIQPAEGIIITMSSKEPGNEIRLSPTNMAFCYRDSFSGALPEAYQRLLLDVLRNDHTLFVTAKETELQWKLFQNVLDKGPITTYPKGTIPKSRLDVTWVDFDEYSELCT